MVVACLYDTTYWEMRETVVKKEEKNELKVVSEKGVLKLLTEEFIPFCFDFLILLLQLPVITDHAGMHLFKILKFTDTGFPSEMLRYSNLYESFTALI